MVLGLETLLLAIPFILPGFLTTKLITSRTPSKGKDKSDFIEITNSLLRSIYINLIDIVLIYLIIRIFFISKFPEYFSNGIITGFIILRSNRPLQFILFLTIWITTLFIIAIIFGCFIDPLDVVEKWLSKSKGTFSEDPLYSISKVVLNKRKSGSSTSQLWVRIKMKDGSQYKGQLMFGGYRIDNGDREIILANVTFRDKTNVKFNHMLDYVFLSTSECTSMEFIVID